MQFTLLCFALVLREILSGEERQSSKRQVRIVEIASMFFRMEKLKTCRFVPVKITADASPAWRSCLRFPLIWRRCLLQLLRLRLSRRFQLP